MFAVDIKISVQDILLMDDQGSELPLGTQKLTSSLWCFCILIISCYILKMSRSGKSAERGIAKG